MHDILVEELEGHLSGNASQAFYDHLDACADCSAALAAMTEISICLRELKPPEDVVPEPSLGFYNRVAGRIVENQRKEAWGFFSPGAAFFRRVAFASLLVLAGLGSFLVTRDTPDGGTDAAALIAQHDPTAAHSESADRDRLLVTLANYRE
jgi:predicted anti-sigma-YlaC factor YlaD